MPFLNEPTVFGRIVTGADVEEWVIAMFKRWSGTYIAEVERQHGLQAGQLARVHSWVTTPTLDKWPEDQLPAILVMSLGVSEPPQRTSDVYRARWTINVAAICSARTEAETRLQAMYLLAAHRALLLQRPSLEGYARGVVWGDEDYTQLAYDDARTLAASQAAFTVEVDDVQHVNAGPITPDDPLNPDTLPWPLDPETATVHIEVDRVPLP